MEWPTELVTAWQDRLARLGIVQPVEQAARDVVEVGRFFFLCDEIGWLDQTRMRAFLHARGWKVPWLGPFDHTPFARRQLFRGGPTALLWLAYRDEDGRVSPVSLTFESATDETIRASSMENAVWLSEIGRDVLGAAAAGRP